MSLDTTAPPAAPPGPSTGAAHGARYDGPRDTDAMIKLAEALCGASALPGHLQRNPGNLLLTMVAAQGLNVPLFTAIQSLYPSAHPETGAPGGLASASALQRALVLRAGYNIEETFTSTSEVVLTLADPSGTVVGTASYSQSEADEAGLPESNKWFYEHHPGEMVYARASTRLFARFAAHVTLGLADAASPEAPYSPAPSAPEPPQGAAPSAFSPLRANLDAATRTYDPAADRDPPADLVMIAELPPDAAAEAARVFAAAAQGALSALAEQLEADPDNASLGERHVLAYARHLWATERAAIAATHAAQLRAQSGDLAADSGALAAPAPQAAAPAPLALTPAGLPRRTRKAPEGAPAPVPGAVTDLAARRARKGAAPAAEPGAEPAPAGPPAPRRTRTRKTAAAPQAPVQPTLDAPGEPGAAPEGADGDGAAPAGAHASPEARAAELWRRAQDADAGTLTKIYREAAREELNGVEVDGTPLAALLSDHAAGRQAAAPRRPGKDTPPASAAPASAGGDAS